MDAKPFPHSMEAERALLGGLVLDPEQFEDVGQVVKADDFYRPDHGTLFELLREMRLAGDAIDMVTIHDRVSSGGNDERYGGLAYVLSLPEAVPSTTNLKHYAEVVRGKSTLRRVIRTSQELATAAYAQGENASDLIERAAQSFLKLGESDASRSWTQVSMVVDEEIRRIERLSEEPGGIVGVTTGFTRLDDKLAGLHPTDLIILAARPAMGKTALALNLAQNAAVLGGKAVALFSFEMSRGQLVTRMLCCLGSVEGGKVRTGELDNDDWARIIEASEVLREQSIHIDDTPGVIITDVKARARRLKAAEPNLGLIVIDYLQLMQGDDPKSSRQQQISDISRGLKILAKDLEVPVLALSQLNRGVEQRAEKRPMVSDLRESGAIEQDADIIMFIYRDEIYNVDSPDKGLAEVIIAKQRNGPTGTVKLAFQGQFTRFDNLADEDFVLA
jgi:replicative DNA helicase